MELLDILYQTLLVSPFSMEMLNDDVLFDPGKYERIFS